jgi:hypothetical protein
MTNTNQQRNDLNRKAKEKSYRLIAYILSVRSTIKDASDRMLIDSILKDMAEAQGLSYQTDLLDDKQQSA